MTTIYSIYKSPNRALTWTSLWLEQRTSLTTATLTPKMFHQALQSFSGQKGVTLEDLPTWKSWNRTLLSLSLMARGTLCTKRCCFLAEPHITAKWGIKVIWLTKSKWAQYKYSFHSVRSFCAIINIPNFLVPKSFFYHVFNTFKYNAVLYGCRW